MEKRLFDELVASLQEAADIARGFPKLRSRRRLAERIREERLARQMIGPRGLRKKLLRQRPLRVRRPANRLVRRRKIIER
jgi:hypothetical protein